MALLKWPALIDVHVHLREPGATYKEDFASGSLAAVRGGFGYVLDMPNNKYPTVTKARLEQKIRLAEKVGLINIGFHFGTNGKNIKEFAKVWHNPHVFGLKLYCNHTTGEMLIEDLGLLEKVFEAWKSQKPILVHAEGVQLAAVMALAHVYKRRLHVCHISQAIEVELVKKAKQSGVKVTAGVCPHHLFMTGEDRKKLAGFAMMKPPLGTTIDQQALWKGLKEGVIDLVETDHAPHTREEKLKDPPAYGVPGLETALGLMLLAVKQKKCSLNEVRKWLHDNPRKIFNIPVGKNYKIEFDPDEPWVVDEKQMATKCDWTPFNGWKLYGQVKPVPFYDPHKSYQDNFDHGPFGGFADGRKCQVSAKSGKKFLGQVVDTPFGIPAGPLLNGNFVAAAFAKGFDIATYKTVRTREYPCHPWPNVLGVTIKGDLTLAKAKGRLVGHNEYAKPLSITNSFGVPSKSVDWWQKDMAKAVKSAGMGQVMVGSFQGTGGKGGFAGLVKDYVLAAKLVKETGAKILEANLSCPNEGKADLLCFDVEGVRQIAEEIKNEIGNTPLILKLAYFQSDDHLLQLIKAVGKVVDGLAAINTIAAEIVNGKGKQALPGEGRLRSGVCGSGIKWAGVDMVKRLKTVRSSLGLKFAIIGVGGVTEVSDYQQYLKAGADAVMSATGAMWDPDLGCKIKIWQNQR